MPRHSMYGIDAYIDFSSNPNVGVYSIHGVFGMDNFWVDHLACLDFISQRP